MSDRDGHLIASATGATYRVGSADRGEKISVRVTGKRTGYRSVSHTSNKVPIS